MPRHGEFHSEPEQVGELLKPTGIFHDLMTFHRAIVPDVIGHLDKGGVFYRFVSRLDQPALPLKIRYPDVISFKIKVSPHTHPVFAIEPGTHVILNGSPVELWSQGF